MSATASMTQSDLQQLLASSDLLTIGQLADAARRERHGDRATFVTVVEVAADSQGDIVVPEDAGEVRIVGRPATMEDAEALVRRAKAASGAAVLTGFSLGDLIDVATAAGVSLEDFAKRLAGAGLEAVAEAAIDALADPETAIDQARAGGLQVWRAVIQKAPWDARLGLIARAADVQAATGAFQAFAPLPRVDDPGAPGTGFDDVRTVAAARLMCGAIPNIQVDWAMYGPKLAQVALTYGANDIDGIAAVDTLGLGWRRAPVADIERNIKAAGQQPAARTGRFA